MSFLEQAANRGSISTGYDIDYSCRYNVGDSPILKRDVTVAGNRRTSTWSAWVKIGWNTFKRNVKNSNRDLKGIKET